MDHNSLLIPMFFFSKDEFIAFWKIIYNLFTDLENEAEMYHAAATVATLLMKLGEATKKLQTGSSDSPNSSQQTAIIKEAIRDAAGDDVDKMSASETSTTTSPNRRDKAENEEDSSKWCITW